MEVNYKKYLKDTIPAVGSPKIHSIFQELEENSRVYRIEFQDDCHIPSTSKDVQSSDLTNY